MQPDSAAHSTREKQVSAARGLLVALNARARQLLQGLRAAPGTAFEALFCEPCEQVLARLRTGAGD